MKLFGILPLALGIISLSSVIESGFGISVSKPRPLVKSASRSMVYFISRGIEIKKQENSLIQRVKRAVLGAEDDDPVIKSLFVASNITSRFSHTQMESVIQNPWDDDKEATFRVMLPENAFMSNFTMYIDGELYVAEVKSKEDAERDYKEAQEQNKTAGMVENERWEPEEEVRGMDKFKVSVNIAGNSSIAFALTYMELLQRRGQFEQRISVRPDQIVDDLEVLVLIYEPQGITNLEVREPGSNSIELEYTELFYMTNEVVAEIRYHPTVAQQKKSTKKDHSGVKGDLVVTYDVVHGNDAGLVQVEGDYFVHFFSPSNEGLAPLPKNIIFVIDISGSMSGDKIVQTRESMLVVLDQLRADDKFLILLFDDDQKYWPSRDTRLMSATSRNIDAAKGYVRENVKVDGGTNINDALVKAARFLRSSGQYGANMIVFLTDGDPTVGVTDTETILANVAGKTRNQVSIFSLGFGFNMNFDLLRAISFRNGGFARRIYSDVNADVQLQEFFSEINTPLLYDVKVDYGNFKIALTQTNFAQYFQGSEIVIAGKFENVPEEFDVRVLAMSQQPVDLQKHIICSTTMLIPDEAKPIFKPGSFERLYVYLKIKDQLRKVLMTDDETEKKALEDYALEMALEYHLVTPLTSFIIVQKEQQTAPQDESVYYDMGMVPAMSAGRGYNSNACTIKSKGLMMWIFAFIVLVVRN